MKEIGHIAFICDGNGRWAKSKSHERTYGHSVGSEVVKNIAIYIKKSYKVKKLSFYIFSTENWKRPKVEVAYIIKMIDVKLKKWHKLFIKENVRLKFIGSREGLSKSLLKIFEKYELLTKDCDGMVLNLCFNYGGRTEIIDATKKIISDNIDSEQINEELFKEYLYEPDDVDLLIRTSGEKRISNYLLWQLAYSELVFIDYYWPEMNNKLFDKAIEEYNSRNRRYGGLKI
ncbi:MAG: polyprenyl diphosphate synthase [Bacilli bacterium]